MPRDLSAPSSRNHFIAITTLFSAFALLLAVLTLPVNPSSGDEPNRAFKRLFNGNSLEGWHGDNPHETVRAEPDQRQAAIEKQQPEFLAHWSVSGDELVNDGHGPYATTDQEFGDIEFKLEYKTVALADSGIYLRGSPQVQIWDTTEAGGKWNLHADRGSGGLFNNPPDSPGQSPLVHADRPFGEWNEFVIRQVGSRTSVMLNGKTVVDRAVMENYWDREHQRPLPARGPIHLQTHGGEIRWRHIEYREIGVDEGIQWLRGSDEADGFKPIFNGVNLDGWKGAVDQYDIVDGVLIGKKGSGGVLFTEEEYGDFAVRLEFKLPPAGNNGLAIRYPGTGRASYDGMTELQILDDEAEVYAKLDPRQYHGSAYGMVPAHRGYLRKAGEWNYQEVIVRGSTIQVELNGVRILNADLSKVTEFKDDRPHPGKDLTRGHFGFAGHNDPVEFRNIAIKRLD